jgi:phosphoribosylglycinamide formyltransferase-1
MENASIAIFASGNGSNARRIIEYFKDHPSIKIKAVFTNKSEAGVVQIANELNIPVVIFSREDFYKAGSVVDSLTELGITHLVLAGFLWLIPEELIKTYSNRIINIHPALLPKYGGRGMYGKFVHEAVSRAKEKETGITIHLVNENYDEGKHLLQKKVLLTGSETVDEIALKVRELEHEYFPVTIEQWIKESY